ncbi:fibronectin type III domain-containing protein [Psychroserpens ponticola]|uniref:Fibronectin type III domain-containing protein n=1 Tax=Psychroserpens ponticola TaxID=2932268 RepID=A0ABY7RXJ2_9FLAO|nr:fibronectin type III domain-containing protein [Psychroserpens ponticola]WCO01430.1 fibronectin type III domain-containing protein [Psychroserpens ponticola]
MRKIFTLLFSVLLLTCSSDSSDNSPDPENCNIATALSTSNIGNTSAELNWTSNESNASFEIQYGISGFNLGNGQIATSNTTSLTLSNLTEATNYQFYVRVICSSNNLSNWSNAANFSTTEGVVVTDCQMPGPPIIEIQVTEASAELSWSIIGNDINLWEVEYGLAGFSLGTGTTITSTIPFYTLNSLTPQTQYEFYVKSICSSTNESQYLGPIPFTTLANCAIPTNLFLNQVTHCSVAFDFNPNGETAYEIEYGESGFALGTGMTMGTSSNINTITDLNPATTYEFYVRANCGSEGFSDYSDALVITTNTLGFTGSYLLEQLTPIGANGPYLSNGASLTITAPSENERSFFSQIFPLLCPDALSSITFNLNCNETTSVNNFDSLCTCGGTYEIGPGSNSGFFTASNDTTFELTFTADLNNSCGPPEQFSYRFTKQ